MPSMSFRAKFVVFATTLKSCSTTPTEPRSTGCRRLSNGTLMKLSGHFHSRALPIHATLSARKRGLPR